MLKCATCFAFFLTDYHNLGCRGSNRWAFTHNTWCRCSGGSVIYKNAGTPTARRGYTHVRRAALQCCYWFRRPAPSEMPGGCSVVTRAMLFKTWPCGSYGELVRFWLSCWGDRLYCVSDYVAVVKSVSFQRLWFEHCLLLWPSYIQLGCHGPKFWLKIALLILCNLKMSSLFTA